MSQEEAVCKMAYVVDARNTNDALEKEDKAVNNSFRGN